MQLLNNFASNIARITLLLLVVASFSLVPILSGTAAAATTTANCPEADKSGQSQICPGNLPQAPADSHAVDTVKNITFSIIGGLCLLIISVSGLRYITSAGDPQKAAQARNGVIYALIGLAVALAADAIVSYVVKNL
jgi:hypothetical protein